jgi:hypothetical protein
MRAHSFAPLRASGGHESLSDARAAQLAVSPRLPDSTAPLGAVCDGYVPCNNRPDIEYSVASKVAGLITATPRVAQCRHRPEQCSQMRRSVPYKRLEFCDERLHDHAQAC